MERYKHLRNGPRLQLEDAGYFFVVIYQKREQACITEDIACNEQASAACGDTKINTGRN